MGSGRMGWSILKPVGAASAPVQEGFSMMNWHDLKASLQAFFQNLSLPNQHQQPQMALKPIPVETRPAHPRRRDTQRRHD